MPWLFGPVIGVSTSRKGRVVGGTTGGRPQGVAAPGPPGIARDATASPARAVDPQGSTGARLARGSGWGRRRRQGGRDVSNDGVAGPRVAPSSPAGGTRGIGRTRGRFRVRSRSTGGGFEFKAARRPSTPAGAPAKAGATVTTGGAYRSDQPRLRRQGAFCPARTTACDRKIAPDASFYYGELVRERWSRQLACASRRNLHRNVGALVVPPGQNGANVERRFAFLTSIWVARGGPPANGFWSIFVRY